MLEKEDNMLEEKYLKKVFTRVIIVYFLVIALVYAIGHKQFNFEQSVSGTISPLAAIGELTKGDIVTQQFECEQEYLDGISILPTGYGKDCKVDLDVQILNDKNESVFQERFDDIEFLDNKEFVVDFSDRVYVGKKSDCTLMISVEDIENDKAISFFYGNSINLAKGSIAKEYDSESCVKLNGKEFDGELYLKYKGSNELIAGKIYWIVMPVIGIFILLYGIFLLKKFKQGKTSLGLRVINSFVRYRFLIEQLVKRDFKTKYKRSVLGVFWSFLNPLLTMLVQYIVFSTIFSTGVANYPVYLLSGIVMFNFFNEACSIGLTSITGNSSLITKVYVPKFIYPLARVLSSLVNLVMSLIPLFIVTFATGLLPKPSFILILYPIICLMVFTLGISYLLSTMMVFFRDTQFIWNVLIMIWLYATPIFYTENIIPSATIRKLYHCNPMYQFITFARTVLIDGVSPSPTAYILCLVASVVPFILGIVLFKKNQDKFIFNL